MRSLRPCSDSSAIYLLPPVGEWSIHIGFEVDWGRGVRQPAVHLPTLYLTCGREDALEPIPQSPCSIPPALGSIGWSPGAIFTSTTYQWGGPGQNFSRVGCGCTAILGVLSGLQLGMPYHSSLAFECPQHPQPLTWGSAAAPGFQVPAHGPPHPSRLCLSLQRHLNSQTFCRRHAGWRLGDSRPWGVSP